MGKTGGRPLSCRRYEEIDLPAFFRHPRDGAFDAFREHYPGCAECAAEVRVWSAMLEGVESEAGLSVHPSPTELECFEREPATLAAERSDFIASHLRTCAPCADELAALRNHDPSALQDLAERLGTEPARGWRRWFWNPAFGLVLVGLLALPVLYRSVGPGRGALPTEDTAPAVAPVDERFVERRAGQEATPDSTAPKPSSADRAPKAQTARSPSMPATAELDRAAEPAVSATSPIRPESRIASAPKRLQPAPSGRREIAETEAPPSGAPALEAPPAPAEARNALADSPAPAPEVFAEAPAPPAPEHPSAKPRKSEDPLAHHVFIPTMRLRPGQTSWGPASELRPGFFLEIPLPRDTELGRAQVLIVPEDLARDAARNRESLTAQTRALDSLAGRSAAKADAPREFQERVPVEAKQRSLMLQIPADVFEAGRYRVELELTRGDGDEVQGRGRFRLELLDE